MTRPVRNAALVASTRLQVWFTNILIALTTVFTPGAPVTARRNRAVTFLEYALMAGIVIIVGIVVLGLFTGILEDMWSQISGGWSSVMKG